MYEILAGMDAYITDYSSAIFEAGFAKIPAFIYADDIVQYANDRGSLMWNLTTDSLDCVHNNKEMTPGFDVTIPFAIANDNDEMEKDIEKFSIADYIENMNRFHDKIGLVFQGNASEQLAKVIGNKISSRI